MLHHYNIAKARPKDALHRTSYDRENEAPRILIIGASLSEPHSSHVNGCSVGIYNYITSAMQGIFGASLRNVVVMQHCLCVMCIYWNKLLIAAKLLI